MRNRNLFKFLTKPVALGLLSTVAISSVQADELRVTDGNGSSYLRVQTEEDATSDLRVSLHSSNGWPVTLKLEGEGKRNILATSSSIIIPNVESGSYSLAATADGVRIDSVDVVRTMTKSEVEGEASSTAYAVGATAVVGGIAAAVAGGSDAFSSDSSSSGGSARSGDVGTSGVLESDSPEVPVIAAQQTNADANRPNAPVPSPVQTVIPSSPVPSPSVQTPGNIPPSPAPAPSPVSPMTPS